MHRVIPVAFLFSGCSLLAVEAQIHLHKHAAADLIGAATAGDLTSSATHDGGHGHGHEKFFMYAHQPDKKEYEFGFKRGNGYHNIERYEKGGPHHNFKTKVRWHDAKEGHGEHYWDYNHAPKYHDDHHDDHDDHHDDHHGDDHHGGGHGYGGHGGDHHDDHGGYHSHPIPEYVPALAEASSRSLDTSKTFGPLGIPAIPAIPGITKREGIAQIFDSSDSYRPKEQTKKRRGKGNKVGVDKDSGLDEKEKKKFQTNKEIQEHAFSRVPQGAEESPSAFPVLLGLNPYLPPDIANREFLPGGLSPSLKASVLGEMASTASPLPPTFGHLSRFQDGALASSSSSAKGSEATVAKKAAKMPPKASAMSTLSFDLESGRIYDEESGVWYSLVPTEE